MLQLRRHLSFRDPICDISLLVKTALPAVLGTFARLFRFPGTPNAPYWVRQLLGPFFMRSSCGVGEVNVRHRRDRLNHISSAFLFHGRIVAGLSTRPHANCVVGIEPDLLVR